jgi:AcrR family transcriptional regulator
MSAVPTARTRSVDVEQALVDAAERVLVRDGLDAVTVRAVAAEARVAPMGVYNHLGGKEGLLAALLVRGFVGLHEATVPSREVDDPYARMLDCGRRYREFALSHPQHYAAMFDTTLLKESASAAVQEHAAAAFGVLVETVAYAMARGAVGSGNAHDLAQQIWSSVHGAVSLELKGLVLTPDPGATYASMLELLARGAVATNTLPG